MRNFLYMVTGIVFGVALYKGEAVSWFRMQEMFRFQGFQIFGFFMTAVPVATISVLLLKKFKVKSMDGELIQTSPKKFTKGTVIGSALFGIGWGLTGTCPAPIYIQIGGGALVAIVSLFFALAGTWVYGYFQKRLPH
ncbi:MAG: YeeE/YedE family protein [Bacteroidetes bacterium]|nr:YeeE/YedE family protein [Bacteroidota bacterium]